MPMVDGGERRTSRHLANIRRSTTRSALRMPKPNGSLGMRTAMMHGDSAPLRTILPMTWVKGSSSRAIATCL